MYYVKFELAYLSRVTNYGLKGHDLFFKGCGDFCVCHNVQHSLGTNKASCPVDTKCSFHGVRQLEIQVHKVGPSETYRFYGKCCNM
jgi:hypothetical protein